MAEVVPAPDAAADGRDEAGGRQEPAEERGPVVHVAGDQHGQTGLAQLADLRRAVAFDRVAKIEIHRELRRPNAAALVVQNASFEASPLGDGAFRAGFVNGWNAGGNVGWQNPAASILASVTFDEDGPAKRPSVQVGDPFMEKLLIEATLELARSPNSKIVVIGNQQSGGLPLILDGSDKAAGAPPSSAPSSRART